MKEKQRKKKQKYRNQQKKSKQSAHFNTGKTNISHVSLQQERSGGGCLYNVAKLTLNWMGNSEKQKGQKLMPEQQVSLNALIISADLKGLQWVPAGISSSDILISTHF